MAQLIPNNSSDCFSQRSARGLSPVWSLLRNLNGWTIFLTLALVLLIAEQARYKRRKQGIAGLKWTVPLIGQFLDSMHPTFEGYLAKWESGALSCVSVFHKFVVIASTRDLSRKILNSPQHVRPCLVDAAKKILLATNWVFLDGKAHVEYRKGLNPLFHRKSLVLYIPEQLKIYDKYFNKFCDDTKDRPLPFMTKFRDLNVAVSCRTFFGYYIKDEDIRKISEEYWRITVAMELVNFPVALPYSKVWYGIQARKTVIKAFEAASSESRKAMLAGEQPSCMVDAWIQSMLQAKAFSEAGGAKTDISAPVLIRDFSDNEIAQTMLSFLFASQDATSSAISWMFQRLCDNPDVYAKVRAEQLDVRGGDAYKKADMDMYDNMLYTRAMVKETLRVRPPVLMVPYEATKPFPITDDYTVPKGSMIIPTFWHSLHDEEVYPDATKWDPDRWISGTAGKNLKNFLVFGTGPHHCLGQSYAILHLTLSAGIACLLYDIDHIVTATSEKIKIIATTFPEDDCILQWKRSEHNRD